MIGIYLVFSFFIIISDLKKRVIPDALTIPGSLVGILLNTFFGSLGFKGSIEGLLSGWAVFLIAGVICSVITKEPSVGGGDLKLMGMVGAFWGVKVTLLTFAIAPFLASIWAMNALKNKSAYGIFIVAASLISLFWR